jgi:predicted phosphodiesterase
MKIQLISDKESPALYHYFEPERFADMDLVISCGDLCGDYLEFVISMLNKPCYYVPGNHDAAFVTKPPPGWRPLDGKLIINGFEHHVFGF